MDSYAFDVFVSYSNKDQEFARQLVTWLRQIGFSVWIDEEQLVPGTRFRAGLEQGLRECNHMIAILTTNYYLRPWTQREIDLFDLSADHSQRRLLAIEIDKAENNMLDQAFQVHQRIRWETKAFDPIGFWKLYCGLKGAKPGNSSDWKGNGEKLLKKNKKHSSKNNKGAEVQKFNVGELLFSMRFPAYADIYHLVAKCLDVNNTKWPDTFGSLQNILNKFTVNKIANELLVMPWALGASEISSVVSLALLPRIDFSYSMWPFIDLACNDVANWFLVTTSLKRSEPGEIWFSWAILEKNWSFLPEAAINTGNDLLDHHFLTIANAAYNKDLSFSDFEKKYNYGIMITPWNHFHLSWLASRLGDNKSSFEHAKILCSTTTLGDMRTGRFLNRLSCWSIFSNIRSQTEMTDLINKARKFLGLIDLKEITNVQKRIIEIWNKQKEIQGES